MKKISFTVKKSLEPFMRTMSGDSPRFHDIFQTRSLVIPNPESIREEESLRFA